jgi:hypothetical protein
VNADKRPRVPPSFPSPGGFRLKTKQLGGTSAGAASKAMGGWTILETEEDFLQAVRALARMLGWKLYHTRDSRRSDPDFPDLVMCRPPRLVIAELKVGTRQPTEGQLAWLLTLADCPPCEAYAWWPKDWPEIEACLKRRGGK